MLPTSRREFVQALAGVVAFGAETLAMQKTGPNGFPVRPLGKTGVDTSIVGLGGWDMGAIPPDLAIRMMHEAADSGITFFDNCWEYHNGGAEEIMGRALQEGGKRNQVFLMTKLCARDYEGAKKQLDDCLRRLRTDRIDLLQHHAVQYEKDPEIITDPEKGALRASLEAQKAGKVRFIGFTGHMFPKVHLKMLAARQWDTVQMPLNIMDAHYNSFQQQVLPDARKRGIGVLGMKSLAGQDARIPRDVKVDWELCRRYALSLPVSTIICGMQNLEELRGMVRIGRDFKPLSQADVEKMLAQSKEQAATGKIEVYKDYSQGYGCSYHDKVIGRKV